MTESRGPKDGQGSEDCHLLPGTIRNTSLQVPESSGGAADTSDGANVDATGIFSGNVHSNFQQRDPR